MSERFSYNPEMEKKVEKVEKTQLNMVEKEDLTAYDEEFIVSHVDDGQDVKVGFGLGDGKYYIKCDFSAFSEKLKTVTPEKLESYFLAVGSLEKQAPELGEDIRRLINACWRSSKIARNMLGNVSSESERNNEFVKYQTKNMDNGKICVKSLSESYGKSVCSEYALMTHHILDKLGIKSSVVVGAFSEEDPKKSRAGRHTFLLLEDGKYVFDPTLSALQEECWPPSVLVPEIPLTTESLRDMSDDWDKPLGNKIACTDLLTTEKSWYGSGA